jgi:GNAT superfamily N-acetyltransferase
MINIVAVSSKKELAAFIDFPHDLYASDPNYVPELFIAQRDLLTTHPFHEHNSLQCFLAFEGKKVVGRIAAILNNSHNEFNEANDGFFGFFDCINSTEVANLLFDTATKWLQEKGVGTIIGPVNFSTNETCGLLIQGFDSPPLVMMTYNAPYYAELVEKAGLAKKVDLIAFSFGKEGYDDKSLQLLDRLQERLKRSKIVIRKVNMKNFKEEANALRDVYNSAWDKNMGFVPMNDKEWDYLAKDLKMLLDPDFCIVAEQDGKIIGFGLALPDLNQILRKVKRGRLLPTGIFKILLGKKKIRGIRIITLGVVEGYRKMGIEACIYGTIIKEYRRKGLDYAEASWTLEHNDLINNAIMAIKGEPYKKYRIYEKAI